MTGCFKFFGFIVLFVSVPLSALEVDRLVKPTEAQISQAHLKNNDACGPLAFMYMLKYSKNETFNKGYETLPGTNFESKAKTWIEELYKKPSYSLPGQRLLVPVIGILDFDLPGMVQEFAPEVRRKPTRVQPLRSSVEDKGNNDFVFRIWSAFKNQINQGIPVVVGIYGRFLEDEVWKRRWGHTITVTGVQSRLSNRDYHFYFEYLDPWTGLVHRGFMGEELRTSFETYVRVLDEDKVLVGKYSVMVPTVREKISSPALTLSAPDLFLGYPAVGNQHEIYVVDNLLFFGPE